MEARKFQILYGCFHLFDIPFSSGVIPLTIIPLTKSSRKGTTLTGCSAKQIQLLFFSPLRSLRLREHPGPNSVIAFFPNGDKTATASGSAAEENELARCLGTEFATSTTAYENT